MTAERTGVAFLLVGVLCFLVGGAAVALRGLGLDMVAPAQTTSLAVAGLMAIAVGAALRRRR